MILFRPTTQHNQTITMTLLTTPRHHDTAKHEKHEAFLALDGFYLGFDFGLKSIGIAIGQKITGTASPIGAIRATAGEPDWHQLDSIIDEWLPNVLVVGIPLDMEGKDLSVTPAARKFSEQLHQKYHLPVFEAEERLTTKEARATLFDEKGFKGLTKANVDAMSAQIILESWLET